jgi:hypothetical protein
MTIQDIITEFGAYYINQGQNASRLVQLLYRPAVTDQLFRSIVTDDTVYRASQTRFGRILQPFQTKWTPTDTAKLLATPIAISQYKMKGDVEETPDTLEATWLGFLADNSLDRKVWPFVRWLMETHLLPQIQEDYELNEVYLGKFVAPTTGVAGAAGTAMDGIKTIINGQINAGRITPISLGAIPTDPAAFVDYVEAFTDNIGARYRGVPMNVAMNETLALRYGRGKRAKYGKDFMPVEAPQIVDGNRPLLTGNRIEETKHQVVALPSMGNSLKIWATPYDNTVRLAKKSQNVSQFQIESIDRLVKLFTDFWKGVGFLIPEAVFTNDQDLV